MCGGAGGGVGYIGFGVIGFSGCWFGVRDSGFGVRG